MKYLKNVVQLKFNQQKCIGCKECVEVCPHGVWEIRGRKANIIDLDRCMECGACQKNCIANAIWVKTGVGCAEAIINERNGGECSCDCC